MNIDNGGPAFPCRIVKSCQSILRDDNTHEAVPQYEEIPGMTLRDYFAAKATDKDVKEYREWVPDEENEFLMKATYTRPEARYRFADDMIKERTR